MTATKKHYIGLINQCDSYKSSEIIRQQHIESVSWTRELDLFDSFRFCELDQLIFWKESDFSTSLMGLHGEYIVWLQKTIMLLFCRCFAFTHFLT